MTNFSTNRRSVLKALGIGSVSIAGLSTTTVPVTGHPSLDPSATDLLGPIQVPAQSESGFNYPYYLYIPESSQDEPVPMLVEPNNTGTATDDYEEHRTAAKEFTQGRLGWTRLYSEALTVPLLVPVFPRPVSDPVNGNHYVHALDETTMNLDGGELDRVDLQLRNMIEHAQNLLNDLSYPVADEVLMNGFSASGNFVNRFTALHPDVVKSVTAGGINGTALLPLEQANGHTLNYHIGIADLEDITGEPFDQQSWQDVPQFIYLGGDDENDTIPYGDAWNSRQRQIALDVYGEDMQNDRMPYCERVYDEAGANAQFEIYEGVGHQTPLEIQQDIVDFHREAAALKHISFTDLPSSDDGELAVTVEVFAEEGRFDLRAYSDQRGDLTADAPTITGGETVSTAIPLSARLEGGETVTAAVVPTGETSSDASIASVTQPVRETPTIQVINEPTVTNQTISVEYAVSGSYQADTPIHMYIQGEETNERQLLSTFDPGTVGSDTYEIDPSELEVTVESGVSLQVLLVDVDTGRDLATDSVVIGGGPEGTAESAETTIASVTFESQPSEGRDEIDISYTVEDTYETDRSLTVQLQTSTDIPTLLSVAEPGADVTETVSLEKIPLEAGTEIELSIGDQQPIARHETAIVRDTGGAVGLQFVEEPSEDDPSATVEYRIDEAYQPRDALTLRAYSEGVPGAVPGESLALLSPGDAGSETFTVGEDIQPPSGELTLAIIDDVPLALTSSGEPNIGGGVMDDSGDNGEGTEDNDEADSNEEGGDDTTNGDVMGSPEDQSGFGIGTAIGGIAAGGYLINQYHREDDN